MNPMLSGVELCEETRAFNARAAGLGLGDVSAYHWYHVVELPGGLITPGICDFRGLYADFGFPADMRGLRVLDVGSATGYFTFEFFKRGAEVISVEVPSLDALDRFPGQSAEHTVKAIRGMMYPGAALDVPSPQRLYHELLEGPFEFCRKQLGAKITRHYSSVYDLPKAGLGRFDVVFLGDILLHTLRPLDALCAAASVCSGLLVLAQQLPDCAEDKPAMLYVGGSDPDADQVQWWWPNEACLIELLKKNRFHQVSAAGRHRVSLRPSGYSFEQTILHAQR